MEAMPRATCPVKEIGRAATAGWLVSLHRDVESVLLRKYCVWTRWVEEEVLGGRLLDGSRARRGCVFDDDVVQAGSVGELGEGQCRRGFDPIVAAHHGGGNGNGNGSGGCPFSGGGGRGVPIQRLENMRAEHMGVGICTG